MFAPGCLLPCPPAQLTPMLCRKTTASQDDIADIWQITVRIKIPRVTKTKGNQRLGKTKS